MAETNTSASRHAPAPMPSTGLSAAGPDADSSAIRSRSRRTPANTGSAVNTPNLTPGQSPAPSRGASPLPSRLAQSKPPHGGRSSPSNAFSRGLLEGSWTPNWSSVQDFASSILTDVGYSSDPSRPSSRSRSKPRPTSIWQTLGVADGSAWGPAPPPKSRPTPNDVATGTLQEHQDQVTARKKASVLQSHEGVNGGLDVAGRFKRRNSDENISASRPSEPPALDHLVYVHHVLPTDTYAGIVLRYRCSEPAFRKTNGIWSQNSIQIRKYLLVPVDACETKGRPCDPPADSSRNIDLLSGTPLSGRQPPDNGHSSPTKQGLHDDYFGSLNDKAAGADSQYSEERPWVHVRWVKLDSVQEPVEIVRVARTAVGYFPPRRKRSINTVSALSTPRHSVDLPHGLTSTSDTVNSPGQMSSRRQSSLSARPTAASLGTMSSGRGRGNSLEELDGMPAWMRRPGGVGTMSRSVKAPGPGNDGFNKWVNKRLPGFNIDTLPSMSIMGSESAQFGFTRDESSGIVESSYEDGRDVSATARNGMGLEQAAAQVETWLRGAWSKRPTTPRLGASRKLNQVDSDLIELTDTNSEGSPGQPAETGLLDRNYQGSSSRSNGAGLVRGRSTGSFGSKGKKAE